MFKDFSGQNLQGKSFKGQDLSGANFSGADIRGCNFKEAKLVGADFSYVKGGLERKTIIILFIFSLFFLVILSDISISSGLFFSFIIQSIMQATPSYIQSISFTLVFTIIFLSIMIFAIEKSRFLTLTKAFAVCTVGAIMGVIAGASVGLVVGTGAVVGAIAIFIAGTVVLGGTIVGVVAGIGAMSFSGIGFNVIVIIDMFVTIILIIYKAVWWAGMKSQIEGTVGLIVGLTIFSISFYTALSTFEGDNQFIGLRRYGLLFASFKGTNFQDADLQNANFNSATLKNCRFNKLTKIKHTCWYNTKGLDLAYLKDLVLENEIARDLLITVIGNDRSYARLNLKGIYLVGADLSNSDFTEANLSDAILENACLKNANFTKAQALGVDFRGADLTGTCLESWNIDNTTNFEGAHADYVYLLNNQKERRPNSGNFKKGEFSKLFQEVLNTMDFIFQNSINLEAFFRSFNKLKEKVRIESENTEISIQSIEDKGDGIFVIRVNVPVEINKEKIHQELKEEYDKQLKSLEEKYIALLEAKEEVIEDKEKSIEIYKEKYIDLKGIINHQAKRPIQIYPKGEDKTKSYKKSEK